MGAGLAIDVTGIDTTAKVSDNTVTVVNDMDGVATIEGVNVAATQSGTQTVTGKAGSSGGTSVTPALSLGVSSSFVEAYLGSGNQITVTGDVAVKADNSMIRTYTGDAQAAGSGVGVGGDFGIIIANDRTTSRLNRSIKAKNLSVTARGVQQTTNTVKAGAAGAGGSKKNGSSNSGSSAGGGDSPGSSSSGDSSEGDSSTSKKGESDAQADKAIASGASLGNLTGSAGLAGNSILDKTSDRQTAQTSEGSISVAAAFGLTIAFNEVIAEIMDGLTIETTEDLTVIAYSDTDSKVFANASATKSKIGIGAAVALNIVEHNTEAFVGDTALKSGGNLTVLAAQIDTAKTANMEASVTEKIKAYVNDMIDKVKAVTNWFEDGQAVSIDGLNGIIKVFYNQITNRIDTVWNERGDLVAAQNLLPRLS